VCSECRWFVGPDEGLSRYDRNRVAIEHHVETGHPIETVSVPAESQPMDEPTSGRPK